MQINKELLKFWKTSRLGSQTNLITSSFFCSCRRRGWT